MDESRSNIALVHFQNKRVPNFPDPLNAVFIGHGGKLLVSVAGPTGWLHSDWFTGFKDDLPPGSGVVAFQQVPDQISVVFHGFGDQLHVTWRARGVNDWSGPVRIANHQPLQAPTSLGLGHLPSNSWFVIYCTQSGAIESIRVDGGDNWQSVQQVCPDGSAEPGGGLAVFNQIPDILTVLYVDKQTELLHVAWRGVGATHWEGPALIHPQQTKTPPGAALAAAEFTRDLWFVFFVDRSGQLRAARVQGINPWDRPEEISAPGIAPPGAGVAALQDRLGEISAFLICNDGSVCAYRRREQDFGWGGPFPLTPPDTARPGASIYAAKQSEGITLLAFPGIDGRPQIAWQVTGDAWKGPARISWFRVVPPFVQQVDAPTGACAEVSAPLGFAPSVARVSGTAEHVAQLTGQGTRNDLLKVGSAGVDLGANTEHEGRLFFFFGDAILPDLPSGADGNLNLDPGRHPPWDSDLVAFTDASHLQADGFDLTTVSFDGSPKQYFPFTIERLGLLGNIETPTGAFSYDGRCYVFSVAYSHRPRSYLASSDRPDLGRPFVLHYLFSSRAFLQIAPWVVSNAQHPGLPSREGDGLVMIAHGGSPEAFFMAWMPLERGKIPEKHRLLFNAGNVNGTIRWSHKEKDAVPIFERPAPGYTAVSLAWLEGPGWILTYVKLRPPEDSIVARVSNDLFRWSQEVVLFDPIEDSALKASLRWIEAPNDQGISAAYGPFLLNRFHGWDPTLRRATITFLMSTFRPYQVHVMRCQITIKTGAGWLIWARLEAIRNFFGRLSTAIRRLLRW